MAKLRRKHVHGSLGEVHRRAALVGLLVERAALFHVVRDVRDVHAQPVVAVRQTLDRDRVVEVTGVLAVDGHRRDTAKIGAALDVALFHNQSEPRGLGDGVLAVRVRDVELADDDLRVDTGLVDAAEHLGRRVRPVRVWHLASA